MCDLAWAEAPLTVISSLLLWTIIDAADNLCWLPSDSSNIINTIHMYVANMMWDHGLQCCCRAVCTIEGVLQTEHRNFRRDSMRTEATKTQKKKGEAEGRKRYNGIHSRYIYGHPFCLVSDARERAQIESFLFLGKYCFAQRTQNSSTQSVRDRVGRVIVIEWRGWDADKHAFTLTDGEWQYHFVWTCLLKYLENISTTELCFSWRENKTKK